MSAANAVPVTGPVPIQLRAGAPMIIEQIRPCPALLGGASWRRLCGWVGREGNGEGHALWQREYQIHHMYDITRRDDT